MAQCDYDLKKRPQGFTLIEVLVVLIIISIIITVAVLAIGDGGRGRKAKYLAEEITTLISYAEQYAILHPANLRLQISAGHYGFKELVVIPNDDGEVTYRWRTPKNRLLVNKPIPSYMTMKINNPLTDSNSILINSNGTISPFKFKISVANEQTYYLITGLTNGQVSMKELRSDAS